MIAGLFNSQRLSPSRQPSLIMTTVVSDDDIEKLPHIQWDNAPVPGPSGCMFPGGLTPLECQIAGHPFNGERQTIGKQWVIHAI